MKEKDLISRLEEDYEFIKLLGKGGSGKVFQVKNKLLQRMEALKVLNVGGNDFSEENIARFRRETQVLASMKRNSRDLPIPEIYEFKKRDDFLYYTMEYFSGRSLNKIIKEKKLTIEETIQTVIQLTQVLEVLHSNEIIHRDIKPENIIIDEEGKPWLVDFGLAKPVMSNETSITKPGLILGTLHYMSPEQIVTGLTDQSSDLYSLAVVFYEMLTSQSNEDESEKTVMSKIVFQQITSPSQIVSALDQRIETVCMTALRKSQEKRYPDARSFREALEKAWQETQSSEAIPPDPKRDPKAISSLDADTDTFQKAEDKVDKKEEEPLPEKNSFDKEKSFPWAAVTLLAVLLGMMLFVLSRNQ